MRRNVPMPPRCFFHRNGRARVERAEPVAVSFRMENVHLEILSTGYETGLLSVGESFETPLEMSAETGLHTRAKVVVRFTRTHDSLVYDIGVTDDRGVEYHRSLSHAWQNLRLIDNMNQLPGVDYPLLMRGAPVELVIAGVGAVRRRGVR